MPKRKIKPGMLVRFTKESCDELYPGIYPRRGPYRVSTVIGEMAILLNLDGTHPWPHHPTLCCAWVTKLEARFLESR